jgi:hypothetical protein
MRERGKFGRYISGRYVRLNEALLREKAARIYDPRNVFYKAMLENDTYEAYAAAVGGISVSPKTYKTGPISGRVEIGHARKMRWIIDAGAEPAALPLDRFSDKVRALPSTTEAERLIIQRIGQDVFRDALMDLWSGRCALTGLDQPEMLRASHMKPWARCESDAERLDPMNGLLLAAHWDAAFDRGLVSFTDDGTPLLSSTLSITARKLLVQDAKPMALHLAGLRAEHLPYLDYHREHIWRCEKRRLSPLVASVD